jgi:sec-independent protein translocase protein TatA
MGAFSIWHWLIVLAVVLVLFGGSGKISSLMGDMAKGIKSFKKGLAEDDEEDKDKESADVKSLSHDAEEPATTSAGKSKSKVSS